MKALANALLNKLSRVTSGAPLIEELDGMRFFAIAWVILLHCAHYWPVSNRLLNRIISSGAIGVSLFFTISGFILALPWASHYLTGGKKPNVKAYFLRRLTRLEPPYILALVIATAWLIVFQHHTIERLARHFVCSLFYCHYFAGPEFLPYINSVFWSLQIEVQFYIAAPLLCLLYKLRHAWLRRVLMLIPALWIGCLCYCYHLRPYLPQVLVYFTVGMVIADLYLTDWQRQPTKAWYWDLLALASVVFLCLRSPGPFTLPHWFRPTGLPIALLVLYIAVFRSYVLNAIVRNRWLVTIGGMCYSLYLYHMTAIQIVHRFIPGLSSVAGMIVAVTLSLLTGAIMFVLFEKPFMYRDWPVRVRQWVQVRVAGKAVRPPVDTLHRKVAVPNR